ncbi:UNVERIFIED_CONTAM: hypothetical protein Sindi_1290700 [Sesamum indicum]
MKNGVSRRIAEIEIVLMGMVIPKPEKLREPAYQPKYHRYTPLNMTRAKALLMVEKNDVLKWPRRTRFTPAKKFSNKYCRLHKERGHDTEECYQLKHEIERLVLKGYFKDQVSRNVDRKEAKRSRSRSRDGRQNWQRERKETRNKRKCACERHHLYNSERLGRAFQ